MLIITASLARHELAPLRRTITLGDVEEGARKIVRGLASELKPPSRGQGFRFYKVRVGMRDSARMIVFLTTENNNVIPLLIRLKGDKIFGINMAMNNPAVIRQLDTNLDRAIDDIREKRYEEFSL